MRGREETRRDEKRRGKNCRPSCETVNLDFTFWGVNCSTGSGQFSLGISVLEQGDLGASKMTISVIRIFQNPRSSLGE